MVLQGIAFIEGSHKVWLIRFIVEKQHGPLHGHFLTMVIKCYKPREWKYLGFQNVVVKFSDKNRFKSMLSVVYWIHSIHCCQCLECSVGKNNRINPNMCWNPRESHQQEGVSTNIKNCPKKIQPRFRVFPHQLWMWSEAAVGHAIPDTMDTFGDVETIFHLEP